MRKSIFILSLIFSTFNFAQNSESSTLYEKEYYDLMNYKPKNFNSKIKSKVESPLFELNTISSLRIYYDFKDAFKLTEEEQEFLKNQIDSISTAFFLEGKHILLSSTGGASGCPDKMIDTIRLNNIEITELKICYSCTENSSNGREFIGIFNDRMYSLMKIEPPNRKTDLFYGEFEGRNKDRLELKLVLKEDRTFKFWLNRGHGSDFTEGLWKNKNDTLILNSKTLNKMDSLSFALSSAKWIEFENLKFLLKKEKLSELNNKKRRLRKTVE